MSKDLDYIAELERENRLLGERCNQLLKDKGDLTDKIADVKANCDLAIEGRDVKIKELELELTVEKDQHQEEINLHLHAEEYIKSLEKENANQKDQLTKASETIKDILNVCCSNCTNPHCVDCKHRKIVLKAEQFLKEIEKCQSQKKH